MAKPQKVEAVDEIVRSIQDSSAVVVTEYRGLTVTQLTALRRSLGSGAKYSVAKNTLVKLAAAKLSVGGLDEMLVGPTAIAFIKGEPVDAARTLRDFAKEHKALVIKGGLMDGRALSEAEVTQIAELDSREVLLSRLAGAMKGNLVKAATLFQASATRTALLFAALRDKKEAEEGGAPIEAAVSADES
jgi:large subunit ribosomal protein L10